MTFPFLLCSQLILPSNGYVTNSEDSVEDPRLVLPSSALKILQNFDKSRKNANNHNYHFEMLALCKPYLLRLSLMLPEKKPTI